MLICSEMSKQRIISSALKRLSNSVERPSQRDKGKNLTDMMTQNLILKNLIKIVTTTMMDRSMKTRVTQKRCQHVIDEEAKHSRNRDLKKIDYIDTVMEIQITVVVNTRERIGDVMGSTGMMIEMLETMLPKVIKNRKKRKDEIDNTLKRWQS